MVQVVLDHSAEAKDVFNIQAVCSISGLKVEPPRKRGTPGQCHRCQLYGHSARDCRARPRCVKCLGNHGTADCDRNRATATEPPSCVLCGSLGHPANYRGCPKAPRPQPRAPTAQAPRPARASSTRAFVAPPEIPSLRPCRPNPWKLPTSTAPLTSQPTEVVTAPNAAPSVAPAPASKAPNPRPTAPKAQPPRAPAPKAQAAPPTAPKGYLSEISFLKNYLMGFNIEEVMILNRKIRAAQNDPDLVLVALCEHEELVTSFYSKF
ncbi:hypothetical protein ABMA27_012737 [Loxostege sticticalis]|uniref:Pre-C2HC domain-containing protein n=1 Tax=Loxostege sticticalis TaxID=481309 RepID=A0ABR3GZM8_LOXSC